MLGIVYRHLKKHYPLYVLLLCDFLLFAPVLLRDNLYYCRDFVLNYYGDKKLGIDTYLQGNILLWNAYRKCGQPFLADITLQLFSPLNLLFFLFPFNLALKLFLAAHVYLAGVGTYALLRLWRLAKHAALFGALVFICCGGYISHLSNPCYLASYAWIPVVFVTFHLAVSRSSWRYLILTAFASCCFIFSGDPLSFLCTYLTLLPYYFIVAPPTAQWHTRVIRFLLTFAMLVIMVTGLAAIQILPTWELLQNSTREAGLDYDKATRWSLTPVQVLQFFCPSLQGNMATGWYGSSSGEIGYDTSEPDPNCYFYPSIFWGTVGIFFFCAGLFLPKNRLEYFCLGGIIWFTALSAGFYLPFYYYWWHYVPFVNKFRYPIKYLILALFLASGLVAFTFQRFVEQWDEIWPVYRQRIILGAMLGLGCYIIICLFLSLPKELRSIMSFKIKVSGFSQVINVAPYAFQQAATYTGWFVVFATVWFWGARKMRLRPYLGVGSCLLLIGQMTGAAWEVNPVFPEQNYVQARWVETVLHKIPLARYFTPVALSTRTNDEGRCYRQSTEELLDSGFSTKSCAFGLYQTIGYDSVVLKRFSAMKKCLEPQFDYLYRFTSTEYIVWSMSRANPPVYPIVATSQSLVMYKNPWTLPRVWFPPSVLFASDMDSAASTVKSGLFTDNTACIEFPQPRDPEDYPQSAQSAAKIVAYSPHEVKIEATTDRDRWLVLSDTIYPGWECYLDGTACAIYPANLSFRAILIPQGKHDIRFVYRSRLFSIGLWVSAGSWSLCLLTLLVLWRRKNHVQLSGASQPD